MTQIRSQPTNKNFLSPLGYKFSIKKTPTVNWFVQSVILPSINLNRTFIATPFINLPVAGDHLEFGNLEVTFRVDEDMQNYLELYNWMQGLGFPDNFDQYKNIAARTRGPLSGGVDPLTGESVYSDATLLILSSNMNPISEITFIDVFPIGLSQLSFDSRLTDVQYVEATVTFSHRKFNVKQL
jgi:hypothetical protein